MFFTSEDEGSTQVASWTSSVQNRSTHSLTMQRLCRSSDCVRKYKFPHLSKCDRATWMHSEPLTPPNPTSADSEHKSVHWLPLAAQCHLQERLWCGLAIPSPLNPITPKQETPNWRIPSKAGFTALRRVGTGFRTAWRRPSPGFCDGNHVDDDLALLEFTVGGTAMPSIRNPKNGRFENSVSVIQLLLGLLIYVIDL
ncbi:uncharacterized protein [Physcomitrium patens]|uniref:Uncharacterized protein n=1 Tax=Physcomitrium patens TaxID=3218 RepID=A0A2K1IMS6_PHYPA|nr:uncharacterized protein LOC112274933 [Physcomitrium patens]PNR30576.1 hypothetical protein PHYPA_026892 [Physcomitrium patens]|eukprot:XP_024360558.1 uncharacterized protein LOC112274933 [Physcomitrella patens]